MSQSSKLILRVCVVAIAGWLLAFIVSFIFADAALVLVLPVLILGPPILFCVLAYAVVRAVRDLVRQPELRIPANIAVADRKSTRLNSSHSQISYAVFCLKKKKTLPYTTCSTNPR